MPHISIVTPVYKAERILPELYRRLVASLGSITPDFEIVMVNDHSPQNDWEIITGFAVRDPRVKGINLARNFGQHFAITAGLDYAEGDWVVVMDCDLQDQPEEISKLYKKAMEGYEVVFGRRHCRKDGFLKKMLSNAYYRIYEYLIDEKVDETVANFSIVSRRAVRYFRKMRERNRTYGSFIRWLGFKSTSIDIEHGSRFEGTSSYTYRKLIQLAADSIVSRSNKPLRLSIRIGFTIATFSLLYMLYLFIRYFVTGFGVQGWTSVMVSIWFIGGLMFMNMGILGLYIGKIFDETKGRPLYVVQDFIGFDRTESSAQSLSTTIRT